MPTKRAHRSRPNPKAPPQLRRLQVFVGRWNTAGEILAGPSSPAVKLKAVDIYEWLPGGFFLLHRVDARMGSQRARSIEILGTGARGALATWSFDDRGNLGEYRASLRGGQWRIRGKAERFHGKFSKDRRTLTGTWERRRGSRWTPWMEIKLTRAK
jgi:hypothetical protein